jgi:predicted ATPase
MQVDVPVDFFPCVWFTPGLGETPDENAKRFSNLDKKGELQPVSDAISKEFPFVRGLSIDYHAGIPMVFAELEGRTRKLPIPLVSDGVNRLLSLCLGLANFSGGTVLIDQIEDGFHDKLLPSIWNSIYTLADKFNVQVFLSSHSAECIRAMTDVVKQHPGDFALLRATRRAREFGCDINVLDGSYLESALEQEFEVR